jgi:hypothetical protein
MILTPATPYLNPPIVSQSVPALETPKTATATSGAEPTGPLWSQLQQQIKQSVARLPEPLKRIAVDPNSVARYNRARNGNRVMGINELTFSDWLMLSGDAIAANRLFNKFYAPVLPSDREFSNLDNFA